MNNVKSLSDNVLLEQCERLGRAALMWRNRFRALLPEVERRKLYLKKGYRDVFEFGKRLAGLSNAQVAESLNIAVRLEDKPVLRGLLESGEVSVNKITKIMSIATKENESELAENVQIMSTRTLETFSRDIRSKAEYGLHVKASAEIPLGRDQECKIQFTQEANAFGFNEEVVQRLKELKQKNIDINEALMEFLDQREEGVVRAKEEVATSLPEKSTRYIPARVRKILTQEYGTKCAKTGCARPSQELHHRRRWALDQSHDPNLMAPLCKEHHQIAHAIDIRVQEIRRK